MIRQVAIDENERNASSRTTRTVKPVEALLLFEILWSNLLHVLLVASFITATATAVAVRSEIIRSTQLTTPTFSSFRCCWGRRRRRRRRCRRSLEARFYHYRARASEYPYPSEKNIMSMISRLLLHSLKEEHGGMYGVNRSKENMSTSKIY